jgi:hypothetical protein
MACACAREANEFRMARFAVVTEGLEAASMLSAVTLVPGRASSINGDSYHPADGFASDPGLQL